MDIDVDSVLLVLCGSLEAYEKDEPVVFAVLTAMVAVLSTSGMTLLCIRQAININF